MSDTMSRTLSVRQEHELLLALEKAGLVPDEAQAVIGSKKNQLAKDMVGWLREQLNPLVDASRFDRYKPHLLSLEDQLNLWEVLDASVLGGQVKRSGWFDGVDASSDHVQSLGDLEIFYVEFGSHEGNIEAYWRIFKANQPNSWRWDGLLTDAGHLRLGPNTRQYEPGIHRIRINLAAHWEPDNGRSVLQVRNQAAASGEFLAHAEVLAAYGLHDELLRQQDGENLPYADMAGFEATVPGRRPWMSVPYVRWDQIGREVRLYAPLADGVGRSWAAPVVRES